MYLKKIQCVSKNMPRVYKKCTMCFEKGRYVLKNKKEKTRRKPLKKCQKVGKPMENEETSEETHTQKNRKLKKKK